MRSYTAVSLVEEVVDAAIQAFAYGERATIGVADLRTQVEMRVCPNTIGAAGHSYHVSRRVVGAAISLTVGEGFLREVERGRLVLTDKSMNDVAALNEEWQKIEKEANDG